PPGPPAARAEPRTESTASRTGAAPTVHTTTASSACRAAVDPSFSSAIPGTLAAASVTIPSSARPREIGRVGADVRVLVVLSQPPRPEGGAPGKVAIGLIRGLVGHGLDVRAVAARQW